MTERYMADSTSCGSFPSAVTVPGRGVHTVDLRAGYINGNYQSASCCQVSIDVSGQRSDADVLDIEFGDATPDTAAGWVQSHNLRGGFPAVLYCNRATITAVANNLEAAGLQVVKDYRWWIGCLDGTTQVADMTGVVAVQAWSANYFPNNIDLSIVYDDSWKPTAPPPPPPSNVYVGAGMPPWALPVGHRLGDINNPSMYVHGGIPYDNPSVVATIKAVQQLWISAGLVAGHNPAGWFSDNWADGRWDGSVSDPICRAWFAKYRQGQPVTNQIFSDDYAFMRSRNW